MSVVITNQTNVLKVAFSATKEDRIPKEGLRIIVRDDYVYLVPEAISNTNLAHPAVIKLLYTNVSSPSESSASDLADTIQGYINEFIASSGGGGGGAAGGSGKMIKSDLGDYTFDASAQTVTLEGIHNLSIIEILEITNYDDQEVIFDPRNAGKGGTIASNVITLEYNTTAMDDDDDLRIYVHYNNSEDFGLGHVKTGEQSSLDTHFENNSIDVDTTNLAVDTYYYPNDEGSVMDTYKDQSATGKLIDADETLTLTLEVSNDEDAPNADFKQVKMWDDNAGALIDSITVTNGTEVFVVSMPNNNFRRYRWKLVVGGNTNTVILKERKKAL